MTGICYNHTYSVKETLHENTYINVLLVLDKYNQLHNICQNLHYSLMLIFKPLKVSLIKQL